MLDFLGAFFLGMKYFLRRKPTVNYPFEKGPLSPRSAESTPCAAIRTAKNAASPASSAKRSARRKRSRSKPSRAPTAAARTTRYDIDMVKCIYCGFCQEGLPGGCDRRRPNFEFATETREELYYDKAKLLANGDRWERKSRKIWNRTRRTAESGRRGEVG